MSIEALKDRIGSFARDVRLNLSSMLSDETLESKRNTGGTCIDAHEEALQKNGASAEAIQTAVRYAAIIASVAVALDASAPA